MGLVIDWTEYEKLTPREEYDAIGKLIDEVKAAVAARRAEIAHDVAMQLGDEDAGRVLGISRQRVGQLRTRHAQTLTRDETTYLEWAAANDAGARRFDGYVRQVMVGGGLAPEAFDMDALLGDYRAAIEAALPEGVVFTGSAFVGPAPTPPGVHDEIRAAVASVDLWEIVARYDPEEAEV